MRRLTVALCVTLLMSIGLPARATAASVVQTWYAGNEPYGVTVDPRDGTVYVAVSDHNNWYGPEYMWAIDPAVPLPWDPSALPRFQLPRIQVMSVLDQDLDRLFVSTPGGLAIVDVPTHALIGMVAVGGALGLALDPASHRVYVTTVQGVALVDGATGTVLATRQATAAEDAWWMVAHDPIRHRAYVTNGNYVGSPSLLVLDDADLSIIANIPLPGLLRGALSVDPVRGLVYVGALAPVGNIYAIDETTLQVVNNVDVSGGTASPISLTLAPESGTLYVSAIAQYSGNALVAVDTSTFTVTQRIPLAFQPGQSALHPDGRLYVSAYNAHGLAAISLANSAPVIDSLTFTPPSPSSASVLTANAAVADPDGDLLTLTYEWRLNGSVVGDVTGATLDLSVPGHGDRGDTLSVLVTASDGALSSSRSASVVVANAAPALALSLSSTAPLTNDVLVTNASAPDADGDAVALTYTWTRNGAAIAGATGSSLDLRQFGDRGDVLAVTVTADDAHGGVTTKSATATVADSAPVLSLTTNNTSPRTNDVIFATATMSDPDGDALCCAWYFKVNGRIVWQDSGPAATWASFDLNRYGWGDRGDTVTVVAVAGDRILSTSAEVSAVVLNSPPLAGVALSDYSPTKKDVLVAYGSVFDADGDTGFLFTYTWRVGQKVKLVVSGTAATTSSFDLRDLQPGDTVSVTVSTTGDGFDSGVPATASARLVSGH